MKKRVIDHRGMTPMREEEKAEQDILQRPEGDIGKAGDLEVSPEYLLPRHPDILRHGSDRTDPAAETFFQNKGNAENSDEHDEPGGMHRVNSAQRQNEVLEGHQAADGKKCVYRGGPLDKRTAGRLEVQYELIELIADEEGKQQKCELHSHSGGTGDIFFPYSWRNNTSSVPAGAMISIIQLLFRSLNNLQHAQARCRKTRAAKVLPDS